LRFPGARRNETYVYVIGVINVMLLLAIEVKVLLLLVDELSVVDVVLAVDDVELVVVTSMGFMTTGKGMRSGIGLIWGLRSMMLRVGGMAWDLARSGRTTSIKATTKDDIVSSCTSGSTERF
jgi:hypothetical protein